MQLPRQYMCNSQDRKISTLRANRYAALYRLAAGGGILEVVSESACLTCRLRSERQVSWTETMMETSWLLLNLPAIP
jgi:hypothetical protein